jgi:hypothetical protein
VEVFNEGYKRFTHAEFLELVDLIRPEVFVSLHEEKRELSTRGKKTARRTVIKAEKFFQEALAYVKSGCILIMVGYFLIIFGNIIF